MKKEIKVKKALNIESQFDKLVALGRKKGHLTYEEINDFLPEDIVSPEQIEKVFTILEKENIDIVDSEEELKPANKEEGAEEGKQIFDTDRRNVAESTEAGHTRRWQDGIQAQRQECYKDFCGREPAQGGR